MKYLCSGKRLWPVVFILGFVLLMFRKIFTQGLYPYPGDLLVSFFYPWQNGGWEGYDPFTWHKEFLSSDAVRQGIVWKKLAIDQLKQGLAPLWNPYVFSGTPLLANLQSAVFYPFNLVFFVLPFFEAWNLFIILTPLLGLCFMYLLLRQYGASQPASLIAGVSLVTSSFVLVWLEIGVVGHTLVWFPLLLWLVEKWKATRGWRYLVGLSLTGATVILAGHFQTGMHVLAVTGIYWLVVDWPSKLQIKLVVHRFWPILIWTVATVAISAVQWLPTYQLKSSSPLNEAFVKDVFLEITPPWKNVLTLFAPDYLGNPALYNFTSEIYGDGTPFVSSLAVILALLAIWVIRSRVVFFWASICLVYFFYGFTGPIYHLVDWLDFNLLTQTLSTRGLIIFVFALAILSSLGLDSAIEAARTKRCTPLIVVGLLQLIIFMGMTLTALADWSLNTGWLFTSSQSVSALKNLVIPLAITGSFYMGLIWIYFRDQFFDSLKLVTLLLLSCHGLYQANRVLSFSPKTFFYPSHPLIEATQERIGNNRMVGLGQATFDKNLPAFFKLGTPEGYDSLRLQRYAEFFAAHANQGEIPEEYSKSDAHVEPEHTPEQTRLLNLVSVAYLWEKDEANRDQLGSQAYKYPHDQIELVWGEDMFRLYKRKHALPRASLYHQYQVVPDSATLLKQLYQPELDIKSTVLLSREPNLAIPNATGSAKPQQFDLLNPNHVRVTTQATQSGILLLTDPLTPGWQARVNGQPQEIIPANYAFRAVALPAGDNTVEFVYRPRSFLYGQIITGVGIIGLVIGVAYVKRMA